MAENADDEELDALGVDLDVVEMTFTNPDSAYMQLFTWVQAHVKSRCLFMWAWKIQVKES